MQNRISICCTTVKLVVPEYNIMELNPHLIQSHFATSVNWEITVNVVSLWNSLFGYELGTKMKFYTTV